MSYNPYKKSNIMKTLNNGMQCEILKVYRGQSNNYKANTKQYADLIKVRLSDGKVKVICSTELLN